MGDGTGGTGRGEDVLLRIGQAEGLGQVVCHGGAETGVALTGTVAVEVYRPFGLQQVLHCLGELRRAGHTGVA